MSGGSEMDTDGERSAFAGVCVVWGSEQSKPRRVAKTQPTTRGLHLTTAPQLDSTNLKSIWTVTQLRTLDAIANRNASPFRPVSFRTPLPAPNSDTTPASN